MILGLIPSRLNSTRLPNKPLLVIDGLPIIIHTMKRAMLSKKLDRIIVCTDSLKIKKIVEKYGGEALITKKNHSNGTERIAEVSKKIKSKLVVDIQGDEPLINPKDIDKVVEYHLKNKKYDIIVPGSPFLYPENKNVVKIVSNSSGKVLYFSRAEIPYPFSQRPKFYYKHLSIVSFYPQSLIKFIKFSRGVLEKFESIELLRAIENDMSVGTFHIKGTSFSVDVKEDYDNAISVMPFDPIRKLY